MAVSLGTIYAELGLKLDKFDRGLREAEENIKQAEKQFGGLQAAGERLSGVGQKMTVGLTLPIVGLATAATNMSMSFNASMADVATLIPGNVDRVEELKSAVQDMAIETGKRTGDMARGLYQVVSAFGDTADTVEILETNARAAAAGLATTEQAIALTSAVTKGYGDTTKEAVARAADLALMTVRLGQTTFPELASSIGRVTPLAATLGVTTEELFATMATLTGVTGGAAEVSTQLRATFQSLLRPTKDMADAITVVATQLDAQNQLAGGPLVDAWRSARDALSAGRAELIQLQTAGADTKALRGQEKVVKDLADAVNSAAAAMGPAIMESVGLEQTIKLLTATAGGNTDTLGKMYGSVEALTGVLALTEGQAGTFSQRLKDMQDVSGTTAEAFDAQTQGINKAGFAWEQLRVQLEVAAQQIGDSLAPTLSVLVGIVQSVVGWFANLSNGTQGVIVTVALFVAALGPVIKVVGTVIYTVSQLKAGFVALKTTLALAKIQIYLFGPAIATVKVAILALKAVLAGAKIAFAVMTGPIGLVIAAVTLLAAGVVLLVRNWETVGGFFSRLWSGVQTTFSAAVGAVTGFVQNLWDGVVGRFTSMVDRVRSVVAGVTEAIAAPFRRAQEVVSGITNTISGFLQRLNPFARNSPSLVDNVRAGVAAIQKEYGMLESLRLPILAEAVSPVSNTILGRGNHTPTTGRERTNSERSITIPIYLDGRMIAQATAPHIVDSIRTKTGIRF